MDEKTKGRIHPMKTNENGMAHGHYWPVPEYSLTISNADGSNPEEVPADPSALEAEELAELEKLNVGESVTFGGGAQPLFTFTRIN